MIRIGLPLADEEIFVEGATLLSIESREALARTVENFYRYDGEGSLKLADKKFKPIKESEIMIVTDILGYDVNSTAMLKLIYGDIENQLNEKPEVKSMIEKLTDTITELISYELVENELVENELDLEYDEITIQELIKALGVQIETRSDSLLDKIMEIIQVYKYLSKKKLLVFVNVLVYFQKREVEEILDYIRLNHLDICFLEGKVVEDFSMLSYKIDEDFCLFTKNV